MNMTTNPSTTTTHTPLHASLAQVEHTDAFKPEPASSSAPARAGTFSEARHAAIQAVKARLKSKSPGAVALHVLYNLLRAVDPRRGFSTPKSRGANAHRAFLVAARAVPGLAQARGIELDTQMRAALQDACRLAWLDNAEQANLLGDKSGRESAYLAAMEHTPHGPDSTVAEHGRDCARRYAMLCSQLAANRPDADWPEWLRVHGAELVARAQPALTMGTYLRAHDIGKVTTMTRGEAGRCHFPGHAAESERLWLELGGKALVAKMMGLDMVLHTLPAEEVQARIPAELLPSMLLATYAELLSNAESVFGGRSSDSFKMKLKALNKRAQRLCPALLGGQPVEGTRP